MEEEIYTEISYREEKRMQKLQQVVVGIIAVCQNV